MRRRTALALAAAILASLVAGCATVETSPAPAGGARLPADFPEDAYRQAAAQGRAVYRIDPAASLVSIEVRRGGSLARLGHDHVVASRDVAGFVAPSDGRADLAVPLASLTVDEPALRAEAGFDTQPSASDIAGTRANMLGPVLDAERYPYALIAIRAAGAASGSMMVAITLHGVTRSFDVPVELEVSRVALVASGRLSLDQTAFGIVPYSLLGGAIAVQDRVELRFGIRAVRVGSGG